MKFTVAHILVEFIYEKFLVGPPLAVNTGAHLIRLSKTNKHICQWLLLFMKLSDKKFSKQTIFSNPFIFCQGSRSWTNVHIDMALLLFMQLTTMSLLFGALEKHVQCKHEIKSGHNTRKQTWHWLLFASSKMQHEKHTPTNLKGRRPHYCFIQGGK